MKRIRTYRTRDGKIPFLQWLKTIKDKKGIAQITTRVKRLALGHRGDFKRIKRGLCELRIHYGPGYRVYFKLHGKDVIVLLIAGDKSTQQKDIEKAIAYWNDYLEQYHE